MYRTFELGAFFRLHAFTGRLSPFREPRVGIECVNDANLAGTTAHGLTAPIQVLIAPEEQRVTDRRCMRP